MTGRLAYYLWRFPVLSETFIRRELTALVAIGTDVIVVADAAGGVNDLQPESSIPPGRVHYLLPIGSWRLLRDLLGTIARRPLRTARLLVFSIRRSCQAPASLADAIKVTLKAVHLGAVLRRAQIQHVHAPWGDTNAFVALVAARLAGLTFSLQFRAHDLHRRTSAALVAEKVRHARFVVTNTDFNAERLRSLADPADVGKIHRIYNGLDLTSFPVVRRERRPRDEIRVLSVARLIEPKGLPYLFQACRALLNRGYVVRCRVIGGPELPAYAADFDAICASLRELALEGHVELAGAQSFEAILRAYADADIFVLPCVVGRDGSVDITPNAILEAMAMALPVVSTTVTALPELIEDEVSGILVPPNDAEALAHAIQRLIEDPALRARFGAAGRRRVQERFDINRNIHAYAGLFRSS